MSASKKVHANRESSSKVSSSSLPQQQYMTLQKDMIHEKYHVPFGLGSPTSQAASFTASAALPQHKVKTSYMQQTNSSTASAAALASKLEVLTTSFGGSSNTAAYKQKSQPSTHLNHSESDDGRCSLAAGNMGTLTTGQQASLLNRISFASKLKGFLAPSGPPSAASSKQPPRSIDSFHAHSSSVNGSMATTYLESAHTKNLNGSVQQRMESVTGSPARDYSSISNGQFNNSNTLQMNPSHPQFKLYSQMFQHLKQLKDVPSNSNHNNNIAINNSKNAAAAAASSSPQKERPSNSYISPTAKSSQMNGFIGTTAHQKVHNNINTVVTAAAASTALNSSVSQYKVNSGSKDGTRNKQAQIQQKQQKQSHEHISNCTSFSPETKKSSRRMSSQFTTASAAATADKTSQFLLQQFQPKKQIAASIAMTEQLPRHSTSAFSSPLKSQQNQLHQQLHQQQTIQNSHKSFNLSALNTAIGPPPNSTKGSSQMAHTFFFPHWYPGMPTTSHNNSTTATLKKREQSQQTPSKSQLSTSFGKPHQIQPGFTSSSSSAQKRNLSSDRVDEQVCTQQMASSAQNNHYQQQQLLHRQAQSLSNIKVNNYLGQQQQQLHPQQQQEQQPQPHLFSTKSYNNNSASAYLQHTNTNKSLSRGVSQQELFPKSGSIYKQEQQRRTPSEHTKQFQFNSSSHCAAAGFPAIQVGQIQNTSSGSLNKSGSLLVANKILTSSNSPVHLKSLESHHFNSVAATNNATNHFKQQLATVKQPVNHRASDSLLSPLKGNNSSNNDDHILAKVNSLSTATSILKNLLKQQEKVNNREVNHATIEKQPLDSYCSALMLLKEYDTNLSPVITSAVQFSQQHFGGLASQLQDASALVAKLQKRSKKDSEFILSLHADVKKQDAIIENYKKREAQLNKIINELTTKGIVNSEQQLQEEKLNSNDSKKRLLLLQECGGMQAMKGGQKTNQQSKDVKNVVEQNTHHHLAIEGGQFQLIRQNEESKAKELNRGLPTDMTVVQETDSQAESNQRMTDGPVDPTSSGCSNGSQQDTAAAAEQLVLQRPVIKKLQLNNLHKTFSPQKKMVLVQSEGGVTSTTAAGAMATNTLLKNNGEFGNGFEVEDISGMGYHDEFMSRMNEFSLSWRKAAENERKAHGEHYESDDEEEQQQEEQEESENDE